MSDEALIAQVQAKLNRAADLTGEAAAELQQAAALWQGMGGTGARPQVTLYSQRDPAWAGVRLGTSASTIGGYGCLMTCAASILTDAGCVMKPDALNVWLIQNGGYANGNHFVFAAIDKLNVVKYDYAVECATKAAPMMQLDQELAAGKYIIVKVDFNPGTVAIDEHWVRYLGEGMMFDPWVGDIAPIVPRYRGVTAAQAILRCLVYRKIQQV